MRQWAFLACRTIALVCGILGGQQLLLMLIYKSRSASIGGPDIWDMLEMVSPAYLLATAFILYSGADLVSRMLIPESRDSDVPAPSMSSRELAVVAWSIVGIWLVVGSAPKLLHYFSLWIWSKAGSPPQDYVTELEKLGANSAWNVSQFVVGAIIFVLAARILGFKTES